MDSKRVHENVYGIQWTRSEYMRMYMDWHVKLRCVASHTNWLSAPTTYVHVMVFTHARPILGWVLFDVQGMHFIYGRTMFWVCLWMDVHARHVFAHVYERGHPSRNVPNQATPLTAEAPRRNPKRAPSMVSPLSHGNLFMCPNVCTPCVKAVSAAYSMWRQLPIWCGYVNDGMPRLVQPRHDIDTMPVAVDHNVAGATTWWKCEAGAHKPLFNFFNFILYISPFR